MVGASSVVSTRHFCGRQASTTTCHAMSVMCHVIRGPAAPGSARRASGSINNGVADRDHSPPAAAAPRPSPSAASLAAVGLRSGGDRLSPRGREMAG